MKYLSRIDRAAGGLLGDGLDAAEMSDAGDGGVTGAVSGCDGALVGADALEGVGAAVVAAAAAAAACPCGCF